MKNANLFLSRFSSFLNENWSMLQVLVDHDESASFLDDWLQANWEQLVERFLVNPGDYLEVYGEGADCNGISSRVLYPSALANFRIEGFRPSASPAFDYLSMKDIGPTEKLIFSKFVSFGKDGWYNQVPPFDKVLCEFGGKELLVDFAGTDWLCREIETVS